MLEGTCSSCMCLLLCSLQIQLCCRLYIVVTFSTAAQQTVAPERACVVSRCVNPNPYSTVTMTKLPCCAGCAGGVLWGCGCRPRLCVWLCPSPISWRRCFGWRAWVPARSCGCLMQTAAHLQPLGVLLLLLVVWGQRWDPQLLLVGTALLTRYVLGG
jgi:hypothetical protein